MQCSEPVSNVASDLLQQKLLQDLLSQHWQGQRQQLIDIMQALLPAREVTPSSTTDSSIGARQDCSATIGLPPGLELPKAGSNGADIDASAGMRRRRRESASEPLQQSLLPTPPACVSPTRANLKVEKQQSSSSGGHQGTTSNARAEGSQTSTGGRKGRLAPSEVLAKGITTVMMHQIAPGFSQRKLLAALDEDGFAGCYNYVYLPAVNPVSSKNGGGQQTGGRYAFIDLVSAEVAASLVSRWGGKKFTLRNVNDDETAAASVKGAFFSAAAVQGLEANLLQSKKASGFRNSKAEHMPFVASGVHLSL